MAQSVYPEASSAFVKELISLDREIAARMRFDRDSVNENYQTYFERLSMFEKSSILPVSEDDRTLLKSLKEDLYLELKLYNLNNTQLEDTQIGLDASEMIL